MDLIDTYSQSKYLYLWDEVFVEKDKIKYNKEEKIEISCYHTDACVSNIKIIWHMES